MPDIISISLPRAVRTALEAEAKRQRRSRSFVVSEAVRHYVDQQTREAFSDARDQTLREGLALSPTQRIGLAEELWNDLTRGRETASPWTRSFQTFRDYERWRTEGEPPQ